jgi:hypothetical protein
VSPASLIQPVHFDDFSGVQFEHLVFAYLLRTQRWHSLEWYGQLGTDLGRDIWGERDDDGRVVTICIQCTNRRRLAFGKIAHDVDLIVSGSNGLPDEFLLVAGGNMSGKLRDKIRAFAVQSGIRVCNMWSGQEFEERLRTGAESLLKRFVQGEQFPDSPSEIGNLVSNLETATDNEILVLMARLFDRPAFYTPFHQESSIPAFKKAITDTIEALNTGIYRLRDGTEIQRLPSRHQVKDQAIRGALSEIEKKLSLLRAKYDQYLKDGGIKPCRCRDPNCPVFFVSSEAASKMDNLRRRILNEFRRIYPAFRVTLPPWHWSGPVGRKAAGPSPVIAVHNIPIKGDLSRS